MAITLEELKEYIRHRVNEVDFLEVLDISVEELVEKFSDEIDDKYEFLIDQFELEQDEDD